MRRNRPTSVRSESARTTPSATAVVNQKYQHGCSRVRVDTQQTFSSWRQLAGQQGIHFRKSLSITRHAQSRTVSVLFKHCALQMDKGHCACSGSNAHSTLLSPSSGKYQCPVIFRILAEVLDQEVVLSFSARLVHQLG